MERYVNTGGKISADTERGRERGREGNIKFNGNMLRQGGQCTNAGLDNLWKLTSVGVGEREKWIKSHPETGHEISG